jgi:Protein of unknown function (DUF2523)
MFGILVSALSSILGTVFTSVLIKFVIFAGLLAVTVAFIAVLSASGLLPSVSSVTGVLSVLPSSVLYILQIFRFDLAVSLCLASVAARFIIRRIPLIG